MKPTSAAASWSEPPARARLVSVPLVPVPLAPLARARGSLRLAFKRRDGATVLDELHQAGCAKARLPLAEPGDWPAAVLINTAGGLTGGDRVEAAVRWGAGTAATVTGQAAEKVYRALAGTARVDTRLTVESGASAEWLPQETILFDWAALTRDIQVELAADARFLGLEALVFGRAAHGEVLRQGRLRDAWRIRRDGRLLLAEVLSLEGAIAEQMARPAVAGQGGGASALATLFLVAPEAEALLPALRDALSASGGQAAASAWDGLLVARFLAADGEALRRDLARALGLLRGGRPLPRVWLC